MPRLLLKIFYISLFVIVLAGSLLFFVKNNQPINFNYVLGTVEWPLSVLLLLGLFSGAILGLLASVPMIFRLRQQNARLQKQLKLNEQEINNLRLLPAKRSH